jgi:uncharacterized membrane protein YfcA
MLFMTLAVVTAVCLFMPLTRLYGVIGSVITLYFYPYQSLALLGALLLAMGAYFYFNHRRKRRAY